MLPILETMDSAEAIQRAIADPDGFLESLAAAAGPVARKWALAKARSHIEPRLKTQGLA